MGRDLKTPTGRPIWVFPAPFFPERFINDPHYTKVESRGPTIEQVAANHNAYGRPNVSFEDKNMKRTKKGNV